VVGDAAEFVTPGRLDRERCVRELRAALGRLTRDADYRAALGARARGRLEEHFAWDAVARQYLAVYARLAVAPS
jgi:alpha-maltose-1-phosphate synthase